MAGHTAPSLEPPVHPDPDVLVAINGDGGKTTWRWWAAGAAFVTIAALFVGMSSTSGPQWETQPLSRDTLVRSVTAVGQLEPTDTVEISSDLSGEIAAVLVAVNTPVTAGQALAQLDPEDFETNLDSATAQYRSTKASLDQGLVNLETAKLSHARTRTLFDRGAATGVALENDAQAEKAARAQVSATRAQLEQQAVAMAQAKRNLSQTTITSPIDGVVLQRYVEPGQTVVSSMSVTPLFEVASDLTTLVAEVGIEEADVGDVAAGQLASFTVPAWPDRSFSAEVVSIDLAPQAQSATVSYRAVLRIDNTEGDLRPGMTATAEIEVGREANMMHVPTEALWFRPEGTPEGAGDRIFVLRGGELVEISVDVIGTSGTRAAVQAEQLRDDDQVVTGEAS
ncbi:MAG: efflux RND transporter periplasmic adaptor subunit [Myxococcota bacterium]